MTTESDLQAMHDLVAGQLAPRIVDAKRGAVVVVRDSEGNESLEALDPHVHDTVPERARGTSTHDTLESLIAHAQRHKSSETVAHCAIAGDRPSIVVVYNAQPAEAAAAGGSRGAWRDHRAVYAFPFSQQWRRWVNAAAKTHSVADFAALLEDGIGDVRAPDASAPQLPGVTYAAPSDLLTLASGLQVNVEQIVVENRTLSNGTKTIQFAEKHSDAKGEPLRVPTGFLLGIPVFLGGPPYAVPVRLRYAVREGRISWAFALHDVDAALRDAISAAANTFGGQTQVPVFYGQPEG